LIKIFKPKEEFNTLGGNKFSVYVFSKERATGSREARTESLDFENKGTSRYDKNISDEASYAGKYSYKVSAQDEYSMGIDKELAQFPDLTEINIHTKIFCAENTNDVSWVMQIDDASGKMLSWEKNDIRIDKCKNGEWKDFTAAFAPSSSLLIGGNKLKLYVFNPGHKEFFIDGLEIKFQ
jgi:hypothetical protein